MWGLSMQYFLVAVLLFSSFLTNPSLANVELKASPDAQVLSFRYANDGILLPLELITMMKHLSHRPKFEYQSQEGAHFSVDFVRALGKGMQGRADLVKVLIEDPSGSTKTLQVVVKKNHGPAKPLNYIATKLNELMNQGGEFEFIARNSSLLPLIANRIYGVDREHNLLVMEYLKMLDLKKLSNEDILQVFKNLGEWLYWMESNHLSSADIKIRNIGFGWAGWRPFDLGVNTDRDHIAFAPTLSPGDGQWDAFFTSRFVNIPNHEAAMRTGRRQLAWVLGQVLFRKEISEQTLFKGQKISGSKGLSLVFLSHFLTRIHLIESDEATRYEHELSKALSSLISPMLSPTTYDAVIEFAPHLKNFSDEQLQKMALLILSLTKQNVPMAGLLHLIQDL